MRGALAARGTRRESAASMPAKGPAIGEDTAPGRWSVAGSKAGCLASCVSCVGLLAWFAEHASCELKARHALLATKHTDHLDWSLPAYRRGTLRGMDAA
ncbi:hypothetical protein EIQ28_19750 [Xanthomonas campestris pv. plantaginis]